MMRRLASRCGDALLILRQFLHVIAESRATNADCRSDLRFLHDATDVADERRRRRARHQASCLSPYCYHQCTHRRPRQGTRRIKGGFVAVAAVVVTSGLHSPFSLCRCRLTGISVNQFLLAAKQPPNTPV
jgi:hypothetical protein